MKKSKADRMAADITDRYRAAGIALSGFEARYIELAAEHLAQAESLDDLVRREGRMILGYGKVMVLHPAITEARMCRTEAGKLLARVQKPTTTPPASRREIAKKASNSRWGDRG
ncbi:hypothetical protein [Streptomyces albireticuli]|uniref:Terminase n=1 Tax=Streptomyces albireticuli TaxID=1940 RepID=A0A2A2D2L2_9ACTN|nr:hypothetical protein [Streptomyces albireticuli]MCD9196210.1 hypothetical protein [Streptomyces albireticuli]PAU46718.1 hypothetical protein CK936_22635 [Streptomyces albireticuli]